MSTIEEDLRFLITELQEERTDTGDELASCPIPGTFGEAWDLFRALCNTRLPKHVSGEFLAKQDKLLHAIIDEEGITYAELIPPCESNSHFAVWRGDITTLAADAIVNAANSQLLGCWVPGHYCIDNAIHTFAGVQLRIECAAIMRAQGHEEPTGWSSTPLGQSWKMGSPPSNTNGSLPQAIGTASTRRRSGIANRSPSAASPPAYSGSRKKKPPALPSTRCGSGLTPTPRPTCTSFSTSTPRKTSKPIARFSANRGKPVVGGQQNELCAHEFGLDESVTFANLGKRRFGPREVGLAALKRPDFDNLTAHNGLS